MIDSRGGVVAVTDPDSPIYGATVHVPPGAVSDDTMFSIREATLPELHNRVLAGPAVELLPAGARFAEPVRVVLPIYDGIADIVTVQGAYLDTNRMTSPWQVVATSRDGYADPTAQIAPIITMEVDHFTIFAPVYQSRRTVRVLDELHPDELFAEILATRPLTEDVFGFTFRTPAEGELGVWGSQVLTTGNAFFDLIDGEYMVRVTADDGSDPRCVVLSTDSSAPTAVVNASSPTTCDRPTVNLGASTQLVRVGETVELTAMATAPVGDRLNYYWNRTGGMLTGVEGEMGDGETVAATWTATRVGVYDVYFTAYDQGTGFFGEGRVTIRVRGNEPPMITSMLATPRNIAQGADEGPGRDSVAPMSGGDALQGLTLLTAEATDPDGDDVSFYWWHALPGNYFDPVTGAKLGRDQSTGYATDTATELPYTGASVLYMAPQESFLCNGYPSGMWLGLHVVASDGQAVDRSWAMVGMECVAAEPEPTPSDEGQHCWFQSWWGDERGRSYCYGLRQNYDWLPTECASEGAEVRDGPCPGGSSAGACFQLRDDDGYHTVRYGISEDEEERFRMNCDGDMERYEFPYSP